MFWRRRSASVWAHTVRPFRGSVVADESNNVVIYIISFRPMSATLQTQNHFTIYLLWCVLDGVTWPQYRFIYRSVFFSRICNQIRIANFITRTTDCIHRTSWCERHLNQLILTLTCGEGLHSPIFASIVKLLLGDHFRNIFWSVQSLKVRFIQIFMKEEFISFCIYW